MDVQDVRSLSRTLINADVCVIGTGPAGTTVARELAGSGLNVVLVESGGLRRDPWSDALSSILSVGAPRVLNPSLVMNRVLGGTSDTWSGRVATFDEVDFAPRDWVEHSGWPLTRDELSPYFLRAATYLGNAVPDNNVPGFAERAVAPFPDFDRSAFSPYAWTFSRHARDYRVPLRFGKKAREGDWAGVRCLLHATATHIDTNPGGSAVEGVRIVSPGGYRRRVSARRVILAAGAIENARLLLASDTGVPGGLANGNDLVGRFLMDHPRGPVGHFSEQDFLRLQRVFGDHHIRSAGGTVRLVPGLALSPELQRKEELLNCALWVSGELSPNDPALALRALVRGRQPRRSAMAALSNPLVTAEGVKRVLVDRRAALRKMSTMVVQCIVEQRPDRESRITLSSQRDALGSRVPVVDWRISDQEARTVRRASQLFASEMTRLGLPAPQLLPMVVDSSMPFHLPDVAHPTGTTRMSAHPGTGVVNTNCESHEVRGLYMAGSSIFPTSGHANPTQMIVAMAIRLADHLKRELRVPPH